MSGDDEDLNLSLALGSANYRVQTKLSSSLGAGVNANFMMDMAFAASDPLSELVWLPHKGLSIKSANSRFSEKRPFLRWNVGPSNEVLPPYQWTTSIHMAGDVAPDDVMLTLSQPRVEENSDVEGACIPSLTQIEDCGKGKGRTEELAGTNPLTNCNQNSDEHKAKAGTMDFGVLTRVPANAKTLSEDNRAKFLMEHNDIGTLAGGELNRNMDSEVYFRHTPPAGNLEVSDKNELCNSTEDEMHGSSEMRLLLENSIPVERVPVNNPICLYQRKGKEKAISDGGIHRRSSNDDNDSNETVDSCSSVGLFSRGIKRENCDQDLIARSKRTKNQIQGSRGSASNIKPHNSFMHWISNMVKGLSDSCKEDSPALGLTLACCNEEPQKEDEKTVLYSNKTRDFPSLSMGFQTMFQSLYSRDNRVSSTEPREENCPVQESKQIEVAGNASLSYPAEQRQGNNENSCKENVISNKQLNTLTYLNPINQCRQPSVPSPSFACTQHAHDTNLAENKATEIPECSRAAETTGPNSLLGTGDTPGKFNYLTSLWITRLTSSFHHLENSNQISQQAIESIEYPKVILESQMNNATPVDQKSLEFKSNSEKGHVHPSAEEMKELAINLEVSSTCKLKPEIPFSEFGSSEAIASVFAKRLDALKHITPPERTSLTCFFCGKNGHELRECAEVSKSDLESLLTKISSFDRMEKSQYLCIRCLKNDHWAILCPSASSYKIGQSKKNVPNSIDFTAVCPQPCASKEPYLDFVPGNLTWNANKSSGKKTTNSDRIERSVGSHSENEIMDNQTAILPFLRSADVQNIDVPVEIFHAIRKLRLSRGDILRSMNSHESLAHLSGFFLRLRLGKMGSTLGETDYYVACITGNASGNINTRTTKSIWVDVEGFRSSIGSQYISNHDFLEDEIKAWWHRILKTGNKIPSADDLYSKLKDRRSLGL